MLYVVLAPESLFRPANGGAEHPFAGRNTQQVWFIYKEKKEKRKFQLVKPGAQISIFYYESSLRNI